MPASGELSVTSKETTRSSPSPVTARLEMTGAWVSRVKSQVSCEFTLEGATDAASIVSL